MLSVEDPRPCEIPKEKPIKVVCPGEEGEPVGLLVDPALVGDLPRDADENARFYPCQVKEKCTENPRAQIDPSCPNQTSYQVDFKYRGKDPRRCKVYQFRTGHEKCDMFYCTPLPAVPVQRFGRKRTDLKPSIKIKKEESKGVVQIKSPTPEVLKKPISEYMASVSYLGDEIQKYNLYGKALAKRRDIDAAQPACFFVPGK